MDKLTKDLAEALELVICGIEGQEQHNPLRRRSIYLHMKMKEANKVLDQYRAQLAREEQDRQGLIY